MSDRPLNDGKIAAFRLLREAYDDACETNRAINEFPVSLESLIIAGASETDLRWLLARRFAQQILEASRDGEPERSFRPVPGLRLDRKGCLVLTHAGKVFSDALPLQRRAGPPIVEESKRPHANQPVEAVPRVRVAWDKLRHELRVDGKLAKKFKHPAPRQCAVLDQFEDDGWNGPVDVEWPDDWNRDERQKLRELVKELNYCLDRSLISFRKDSSGPRRVTFDLA